MKRLAVCLILSIFASSLTARRRRELLRERQKRQFSGRSILRPMQIRHERKSCDLAVRINGKAYFVDGTKIDDHGDAHASDGFCEKIRRAEVEAEC